MIVMKKIVKYLTLKCSQDCKSQGGNCLKAASVPSRTVTFAFLEQMPLSKYPRVANVQSKLYNKILPITIAKQEYVQPFNALQRFILFGSMLLA